MKSRIQSKTALTVRRPTNLDAKTWKSIESIFKASQQAQRATGRFKFYPYLVEVYRTCKEWKDLGVSKTMSHRVAEGVQDPAQKEHQSSQNIDRCNLPSFGLKAKKQMVTGSGIRSFHQSDARTASKSFQE